MIVFSEGTAPIVADVVFVHGLCGDAVGTWTKGLVCWPQDLLAQQVPNVRLLSWDYGASVDTWRTRASSNSLFGHAQDLLGDLERIRKADDQVYYPSDPRDKIDE